jgi:3-hydroxyisobutyrate dehydrogenase-like beta-hydroxyacid dehydrogenase
MGRNIALHLLEEGFEVTGYDVREEVLETLADEGMSVADSPAGVAATTDIVVTSLPDSSVVEDVYLESDGIFEGATPGTVAIETSTIDPSVPVTLAEVSAEANCQLLGAPVSGGPANARDGTLTVMASGSREVYDEESVHSVLDTLGTKLYYTGSIGSGHTLKLLNNMMSMGNLLLAMEAVALGAMNDVDGAVMLEVLGNSGGSSKMFEKRMPWVLNRNFEPRAPVEVAKKDLRTALNFAETQDYPLFLTGLVHQLYTMAGARVEGEDMCAVVKLYEDCTGVPVKSDRELDENYGHY